MKYFLQHQKYLNAENKALQRSRRVAIKLVGIDKETETLFSSNRIFKQSSLKHCKFSFCSYQNLRCHNVQGTMNKYPD